MDDQKVTEIRERLRDISDHVMHARYLVDLLHYDSVSIEDVYDELKAADAILWDEVFSALGEEES